MALSSFMLVLWVHVFLVGSVETSGAWNWNPLLSRNRRDDQPAQNSTVTSNMTLPEIIAGIKALQDLQAKKEALLSTTTEASSADDMTPAEDPVPAGKNKAPKDVGAKTDKNTDKFADGFWSLESLMHKIDKKLKEEETEISKIQKDEGMLLKYLLPDTSPPTAAKVESSGTTSKEQVGKETTPSRGTTPRSEAAPSTETTTGKTGSNGTSKNEPVTNKPGGIGTAEKVNKNGETGDKEANVTPTPSNYIEPSSQKTGGGVQIYIIVVLVVIMVGYIIYANKAKIKACYMGGEKKSDDRSGTKNRSEINYEKLKKDDDDMTLFEKKALKSNYIY